MADDTASRPNQDLGGQSGANGHSPHGFPRVGQRVFQAVSVWEFALGAGHSGGLLGLWSTLPGCWLGWPGLSPGYRCVVGVQRELATVGNMPGRERRRSSPRRRVVRPINLGYLPSHAQPYDPKDYPEDEVDRDAVVSVLGPPIDGWLFEVVYRFAFWRGYNIDWAIMVFARRVEDGSKAARRNVLRIDICHSEVHRHIFKQSSNPADDLGIRETIMSLSSDDGARVSGQWDAHMALISRTWEQLVREWIGG